MSQTEGRDEAGVTERRLTSVRLPVDLLARVDAECDARLIGRNLFITKAVERFVASLPPMDDGSNG